MELCLEEMLIGFMNVTSKVELEGWQERKVY
jgi:hypothetical protein